MKATMKEGEVAQGRRQEGFAGVVKEQFKVSAEDTKLLVEGLTAWPVESLSVEGSSDLRCPAEIVGSDAVVLLSKGFSGTNGIKYTCEDAEFLQTLGTPNLVLVRLEPEARLRLATRMPGTVV